MLLVERQDQFIVGVYLSEYFSGRTAEDLALTTEDYYKSIGVEGHLLIW